MKRKHAVSANGGEMGYVAQFTQNGLITPARYNGFNQPGIILTPILAMLKPACVLRKRI